MKIIVRLILMVAWLPAATALAQDHVIAACKVARGPVIDGRLDDSCWQAAPAVTGFVMIEPIPGAPATQPTIVYVCHDDQCLYIAGRFSEDRPDQLQSTCNTRDGSVYADDCLEVMLDTYCDRANAYYFAANCQGVQTDGRIIDDGRTIDNTWDCRWLSKAARDSAGWSIELAIPFAELRHAASDSMTWGINFYRVERPHGETSSWSPVSAWCRVSRYGSLTGLAVASRPQRFELLPYGLAQYDGRADSLRGKAGLDFRWAVTSNLNANATYLPDYAQVEADPYQFNLSYLQGQELYLPEKRPFFMEGASILSTPLQLFYTRRVSDIRAGAKVYGTVGGTELLALDAQTRGPEQNYSLLRVKRGLGQGVTAGLLATNMQRRDSFSRALGADLCLPVTGPLLLTLQSANSANTGRRGDQWAGTVKLDVATAIDNLNLYVTRIGREFSVAQGYFSPFEIGCASTYAFASHRIPLRIPGLQYIEPAADWSWKRELGGRPSTISWEAWNNLVTVSQWRFNIYGTRSFERYGDAEYANHDIGAQVQSNNGGTGCVYITYHVGRLYGRMYRRSYLNVTGQLFPGVTVSLITNAIEYTGQKCQWLNNTSVCWRASDKLSARLFLQASSASGTPASDVFSRERIETMNSNLLVSYEVRPGSMLYVVFNQPRNFSTRDFENIFMAKFSYSIRF